jgi:protein gp37
MAIRLKGRYTYPVDDPFRPGVFRPDSLPPMTKKSKRIFVGSMGDFFHDDVSMANQISVLEECVKADHHTYIFLTKRPRNMLNTFSYWLKHYKITNWLPKNWWIGVTAENQKRFDERVSDLLRIPADVRFVSAEPLLSAIDMRPSISGLAWVIAGAETGLKARYMEPAWANHIKKQCEAAKVPFFFKRWSRNSDGGEIRRESPSSLDCGIS